MDPPGLSRDARRRVQRAVVLGERLTDPVERRIAAARARRWRERPLQAGLPVLAPVLGGLLLVWIGVRLASPGWAEGLLTGAGTLGGLVGAALACGMLLAVQRRLAGRAEEVNTDA